MPANVIKSFASKSNKSVANVEKLWDKAKAQAAEQGRSKDYAYIVGILKSMLKIEGMSIDPTDLLIELVVAGESVDTVVEKIIVGSTVLTEE